MLQAYSMHFRYSVFGFGLAALLCACAGPQPAAGGAPQPGTKRAWVARFIPADMPREQLPACLANLPPEEIAGKRFVKLHYRHVKKAINEIAPVPPDMALDVNDWVEVLPRDCDQGELTRITRKLSRPTE